jgi:hypothetical protein
MLDQYFIAKSKEVNTFFGQFALLFGDAQPPHQTHARLAFEAHAKQARNCNCNCNCDGNDKSKSRRATSYKHPHTQFASPRLASSAFGPLARSCHASL